MEKEEKKPVLTRAEKAKRQRETVRSLLLEKEYKRNDLLEEATKRYVETYVDETNDLAELKGKIGSSFSLMEEKGEVAFDKKTGICSLVKKEETKKRGRKKKEEPVAEKIEDEKEGKPKKTRAKKQSKEKDEATVSETTADENKEKEVKAEVEKKTELPEFAYLGNNTTKEKKQEPTKEEKPQEKKPAKRLTKKEKEAISYAKLSPEEKLKTDFLKRLRMLGGEYFEYYSMYLLERYCLKNGRRLESFRISGGNADGGIDGEIELTDKLGFRETLYIQVKNWDDSKGNAGKWTVGETLLQQFVGAVTCRQAKEGKRKSRGVFMTTSHFTDGAKEILKNLSADFVGYDCDDVFETAKECSFGVIKKDGRWQLDEKLLSGEKAFFELF